MKILVIGIGTHHGNDQFGLHVINELMGDKEFFHKDHVECLTCTDTGATLLNLMKGAKRVYLIDAVRAGAQVGDIFSFENESIKEISDSISSHTIGLADTLALGKALEILPEKITFYGMEIGPDDFSWKLSAQVSKHSKNFIKYIKKITLPLATQDKNNGGIQRANASSRHGCRDPGHSDVKLSNSCILDPANKSRDDV